ncbi:MAG: type I restriction endonuclease [Chloroflexi bacterium]|nr:type I restriction endonuclease [Chloroflexota bacterium]
MALDDLEAVIEELREVIESHRDYIEGHETRTRQVIVDQLLKALGWDVSDPDSVALEYSSGGGRADYALKSNGKVIAVVEAKVLRKPLEEKELEQALQYAVGRGIPYMGVTNGDEWRLYDVFEAKPIEEKVIMRFCLTGTPAHEIALKSLRMWRANLASESGPETANEPVLVKPEIHNPPPVEKEPIAPVIGDTLTIAVPDGDWRDIAQKGLDVKDTKPIALKIHGDVIDPCPDDWNSILVKVADWLIDKERFDPSAGYRKKPTNKRYLINTEAVHDDGLKFRAAKKLANGMFVETHGGAPTCVGNCRYLLDKYGQGVSVEVKFN